MPVQPLLKALQGQGPAALTRLPRQRLAPGAAGLHHLPQRHRAPAQVGRQARAALGRRERTRQLRVVAAAALGQEAGQQGRALAAATPLPLRRIIRRQPQLLRRGQRPGFHPLQGWQRRRRQLQRLRHAPLPALGPAATAGQRPHHPKLRQLTPRNAVPAAPSGHLPVAGVGPAVAGFLVAPQGHHPQAPPRLLQHLGHRTAAHHQGLPQLRQGPAQLLQPLPGEGPLPRRGIRLLPQLRLHHIQGQHRPPQCRLAQGPMVVHPQIAFEPHHLQRSHAGGGHRPARCSGATLGGRSGRVQPLGDNLWTRPNRPPWRSWRCCC